MPAKDKDHMGEYEAAMLLPSNEHTALLHKIAAEYMADFGGEHLESALHCARLIRVRWDEDLPRLARQA